MPIFKLSSRTKGKMIPYYNTSDAGISWFGLTSPLGPNVLAWYEADFGVENQPGFAATNGQNIARWLDQSGNSRHVTNAANNTTCPTYATNQVNGYPAVSFVGSSTQFLTWASNLGTTTGFTQICVGVNTGGVLGGTTTGGTNVNSVICHGNSASGIGMEYNLSLWGNATPQWGTANNGTAGTVTLNKNGLSNTVTVTQNVWSIGAHRSSAWNFATVSPAGFSLAKLPNGAATYWGTNKIAAMIIYNRALTDAELLQVSQWFGTKYGIAVS